MRQALAFLYCFGLIACSYESGDAPAASGSQFELQLRGLLKPPVAYVFVVDDRADSRTLREQVATRFREYLLDPNEHCPSVDPTYWDAIDEIAIVVRPSATGESRFLTPWDDPRLRWQTNRRTDANATTFITTCPRSWSESHSLCVKRRVS